jgi:hypothetical protein
MWSFSWRMSLTRNICAARVAEEARSYHRVMTNSDDPDWDAWLEAARTTPEELEAQIEGASGDMMVVRSSPGAWRLRPVADTRPLEEYEPPRSSRSA